MHAIRIMKNEAMNLKAHRKGYIGEFERRKGMVEML